MKKIFFAALILMCSFTMLNSKTLKELMSSNDVTWYGLDFSNVKLVGPSDEFKNLSEIRDKQFRSMNEIVLAEGKRYAIAETFRKDNIETNLTMVEKRNSSIDLDKLLSRDSYSFDKDEVKKIISKYDLKATKGIGIVFIMESFNRLNTKNVHGTMWATFFDISTKQVLYAEKMSGETGGFGFRNYWVKSVYNVLKEIREKRMNDWMNTSVD